MATLGHGRYGYAVLVQAQVLLQVAAGAAAAVQTDGADAATDATAATTNTTTTLTLVGGGCDREGLQNHVVLSEGAGLVR